MNLQVKMGHEVLQHAIVIVNNVLERIIEKSVNTDDMQFHVVIERTLKGVNM